MTTDDQPDDAFSRSPSFFDTVGASMVRSYGGGPDPYRPKSTLDRITEVCHKAERDFFYAGGSESQCQRTVYIGQMEWRELQRDLAGHYFRYDPSLADQPRMFNGFTVHVLTEDNHLKAYVTTKP